MPELEEPQAPTVADVLCCSFPNWEPLFRRHSPRSEVLPLSEVCGRCACCHAYLLHIFITKLCPSFVSMPLRRPSPAGVHSLPACGRCARVGPQCRGTPGCALQGCAAYSTKAPFPCRSCRGQSRHSSRTQTAALDLAVPALTRTVTGPRMSFQLCALR